MDYQIHIQKITDLQDELILHYASRDSIALRWLGGDVIEPGIVGSELDFDLEVDDGADGKYDQYFTPDEQLWRVTKKRYDNGDVIWQGFLLPESYNEPWDDPLFYVKFSAVDGLALLKGKYLPEDFYRKEKNVIEFISAALQLTGLEFNIFLDPAIRNHLKKKWHQIIHDGLHYADEDGNVDAYKILDSILKSMQCQLYQANGNWYVEGINKRQLITNEYDVYSISGVYLYTGNQTKNIKQLTYLPTPSINVEAPFKEVKVIHEASELKFPEGVAQEPEVTWDVSPNAQYNFYYSRFWSYNDYRPEVLVADDYLLLANYAQNSSFNPNRKIELKDKPYILKGWRVNITVEVELFFSEEIASPADSLLEKWIDLAKYRISLGNEVLFFNKNSTELSPERLIFDTSGKAEAELTFVAKQNGLLNVEFFEPTNDVIDTKVAAYKLTNLEVENSNQRQNDVYNVSIDENASTTKTIDLEISDDVSALSKCFYLEKIRETTPVNQEVFELDYLDFFTENNYNVFVLSIRDARLLDTNKDQAFYNTNDGNISPGLDFPLYNYEIIYNYLGSELMVLKVLQSETTYFPSRFVVKVQRIKPTTIDRAEWLKWTDDIYKLQQKPYGQIVAEIQQKLYRSKFLRIEATVDKPVKFNDIIRFKYQGEFKYFSISNCEWRPDDNTSTITMIENVYDGASFGNLKPYADAGDDKLLSSTGQSVTVSNAAAFDPDGTIDNIVWQKIAGPSGDVISNGNSLAPTFSNLTGDHYEYELTVTDNAGNTASNVLSIDRLTETSISFQVIPADSSITSSSGYYKETVKYKLIISPDLNLNEAINLFYNIHLDTEVSGTTTASLLIERNGQAFIWKIDVESNNTNPAIAGEKNETGIISYRKGDEIFITLFIEIDEDPQFSFSSYAQSRITFTNYETALGNVSLTGLQAFVEAYKQL
ncbi:PKD domain-containing protein [Mesonia aquimarina]|uniref:PKD domain-containing protein n=1 Tax=Mesonia aquimarina TaxID=1504967 RepID=UPI000EF56259|nr:hypothetical protein [Mesonia aquimarina]